MAEHFFDDDWDAEEPIDSEADAQGTPGARPVGDEAMRLVWSVQDWALGWAGRNLGPTGDGHTGRDCHWCPVCQFLSVLRGERPEVTDRVAEAGTAVAAALRALVEAASSAGSAAHPHREHRPPTPRVQKINLSDEN